VKTLQQRRTLHAGGTECKQRQWNPHVSRVHEQDG
jgi:hypothetical protein